MRTLVMVALAALCLLSGCAAVQLTGESSSRLNCIFDSGPFSCQASVPDTGAILGLSIKNEKDATVQLHRAVCTTSKSPSAPEYGESLPKDVSIMGGEAYALQGLGCMDENGRQAADIPTDSLLSVWIFYNSENDPGNYPPRIARAHILPGG